ncbi:MAG TPA: tetratricopeptide repeat protein [Polyangiaceae bacterium]
MSETKETEPGEKPQAEGEISATEASEAEASESAVEAPAVAPKKKKRRASEASEPETIRDRNERVRAEAAEKRRSRREREQGGAPRRNLDASEMMDDALARSTHAAAGFLRSHFNKVQWVILLGLVGWIGWEVYSWRHTRQAEKATSALFKALSAETGRVGNAEPEGDMKGEPEDARRSFATNEERLKAAKSEYVLASTVAGGAAQVLADLGAAGTAYDLGQYKEAQQAYERVKQHKAYATDTDIKGRTLEGLGMSLEAQKQDDAALKTFHELSSLDAANFAALGLYHQARILSAQGKRDDALKKIEKAGEKLVLLKETPAAMSYLRLSVMELYESLDATKARELQLKLLPGDLLNQLQGKQPGMLPGGALPGPAPAPEPAPASEPALDLPLPTPGPIRDAPAPEAPPPASSGAP